MSMGDILMNRHISYFKQHNDNNICFNVYNLEAKSMLKKLDSGQIDIASTFYCLKCMQMAVKRNYSAKMSSFIMLHVWI